MNYKTVSMNETDLSISNSAVVRSYGTGESHENQILCAEGEYKVMGDSIKDPRPGHDGTIHADRVFIDESTDRQHPKIVGVNFRDSDGNYCCSYECRNYDDFNKQYLNDLEMKEAMRNAPQEQNNRGIKR